MSVKDVGSYQKIYANLMFIIWMEIMKTIILQI